MIKLITLCDMCMYLCSDITFHFDFLESNLSNLLVVIILLIKFVISPGVSFIIDRRNAIEKSLEDAKQALESSETDLAAKITKLEQAEEQARAIHADKPRRMAEERKRIYDKYIKKANIKAYNMARDYVIQREASYQNRMQKVMRAGLEQATERLEKIELEDKLAYNAYILINFGKTLNLTKAQIKYVVDQDYNQHRDPSEPEKPTTL
uniref:CF0 subunit I of ATP synthase n=1 Tax=Stichococcus bacillaris TaxID=37433 RepID=A0A097KKC8_9CHLO|nr:CF0 subunit I of ATP synthase [Stichococcus bacillaris]AIT93638.1 CF0 subunit I of ATP synthase [Stichococcus bacillaris]|mmetsp:Transcript_9420/g.28334  ORF Transcript_9420/g.28334 Transcript_9420/m.28334 type:complete len:208 (-) Transcript_9420:69-692(-)